MFKRNTLFVLGAAASPGFPLGAALKTEVAEHLNFRGHDGGINISTKQSLLWTTITRAKIDPRRAVQIGEIVRDGIEFSSSIDNFLEVKSAESDLVFCCKLAIADLILGHERRKLELHDKSSRSRNLSDFGGSWLQIFAQACFQGCKSWEDVPSALDRISVITFNYDRVFEQFVRISIMRLFSVSYTKAAELCSALRLVHPYGCLGNLPCSGSDGELGFGQAYNVDLRGTALNIRTFTEQAIESTARSNLESLTTNAECIVFLGFGYLPQNLELLEPKRSRIRRQILGTSYGISDYATKILMQQLGNSYRPWAGDRQEDHAPVTLEGKKCYEFLDHFRVGLVE